ncbi:MAG: hypothetical protein P4L57_01975 [Rhizomicrobium sp.]|nr:hypothetical protein [Rhizomicrobium sp.]
MIALSREFPSIFGAPAITVIDPRIFTLRYFAECLACNHCADQCCQYGVDIDWANMETLRTLGPGFAEFIAVPPQEWFTAELVHDPEFPSSAHARTTLRNGKCVFAETNGRGCRIHAYCEAHGLDYHLYKPLVSILFPLTFEQGALLPASEVLDGTLVCSGSGQTLYKAARPELLAYFGEAFVAEVDTLAARP